MGREEAGLEQWKLGLSGAPGYLASAVPCMGHLAVSVLIRAHAQLSCVSSLELPHGNHNSGTSVGDVSLGKISGVQVKLRPGRGPGWKGLRGFLLTTRWTGVLGQAPDTSPLGLLGGFSARPRQAALRGHFLRVVPLAGYCSRGPPHACLFVSVNNDRVRQGSLFSLRGKLPISPSSCTKEVYS